MKYIMSFSLGLLFYWFVTGFTADTIESRLSGIWEEAYKLGKIDGYNAGKAEYSYVKTKEWLESKCMFLYDKDGNINYE
tara:strand:+ start:1054 stop:1290 length:237 start_codon:yes stop_codon:yes gene_type:complete